MTDTPRTLAHHAVTYLCTDREAPHDVARTLVVSVGVKLPRDRTSREACDLLEQALWDELVAYGVDPLQVAVHYLGRRYKQVWTLTDRGRRSAECDYSRRTKEPKAGPMHFQEDRRLGDPAQMHHNANWRHLQQTATEAPTQETLHSYFSRDFRAIVYPKG